MAAKSPTKSEIYSTIAKNTELSRKQVAAVCEEMGKLVKKSLKGPGVFVIPGMCKMVVKKKPAQPARPGRNPFTGQEIMLKAKPASKAVRIRPLKALKEMIQ